MFDENASCPICGSNSLKRINDKIVCLSCGNEFEINSNSNSDLEQKFLFFRRRENESEELNNNIDDFIIQNGILIKYDGNNNSVKIPDNVTVIGDNAFANCGYLNKIIISANVTKISEYAFANCCNLNSIIVDVKNPYYDSRNNCNAIIETKNDVLVTGCAKTLIPESILSIGDYAFSGRTNMTSIIIPNNILSIGFEAFSSCCNLTDIFFNGTKKDFNAINFKSKYSNPLEFGKLHCSNKY